MDRISTSRFADLGGEMARNSPGLSFKTEQRRFRALFGVSAELCADVWSRTAASRPPKSRPVHLLWALLFLKVYGSEQTHRTITGVDEKTFRKWSWFFIELIADLNVVRFTALPSNKSLTLHLY